MHRISAEAIEPGSHIGIAAPSTVIEKDFLIRGSEKLASWGFTVSFDERVLRKHRSFAGNDLDRAEVLKNLVCDSAVRAIWCARGGYGVTRILSLLDKMKIPALMAQDPKLLIGYSDITALHLYFYQSIGLKSLHAPLMATPTWMKISSSRARLLCKILAGKMLLGAKSHSTRWPTKWLSAPKLKGKTAMEGIVLGGNLTLIANLAGTKWQPSLRGAILFIEDCGEAPYRIDRMLTQIRNAGMLDGVRAVICGDLTADVSLKYGEKRTAWKEVLQDCLASHGIPVLIGAPVGHGKQNEPLPLGVRTRITRAGKLEFLEQVVSI